MICRLKRYHRQLVIEVDGKILSPVAYMTYNPDKRHYDRFKAAGVKLYSVSVYIGDRGINSLSGIRPFRRGLWVSRDRFDFSQLNEDLASVAPDDETYIFFRVYLDSPAWWDQENPDGLCRDFSGQGVRQSFASQKWRTDMCMVLHKLIDYIEASEYSGCVIGYQVAAGGTEEWAYHRRFPYQYCDYSSCNQESYQRFLERLYSGTDIPSPKIPSPLERKFALDGILRRLPQEQNCVDYYKYHNFLIADTICYFCEDIKKYTGFARLTGAFYGYLFEITNTDIGHHALRYVLNSPYIDLLASPNSYMDCRSPGMDWPFMAPVDSAALHGKLWFIEADTRTFLTKAMKDTMPHASPPNHYYDLSGVWKGPESKELSVSLLKKSFAKVLCSHKATWWFDMWGGWFDDSDMMDFITQSQALALESIAAGSAEKADVAVLIDDEAYAYFAPDAPVLMDLVYRFRKTIGSAGVAWHMFLLDDIAHEEFDPSPYRLIIFLNAVKICPHTAHAIEKKLKCDHRTLLWLFIEDYFDRTGVCEFKIKFSQNAPLRQAVYAGEIFPRVPVTCPDFASLEDDSRTMAYMTDGITPAVGLKTYDTYQSIYSVLPELPVKLLSDIMVLSGVHIYCYTGDPIWADSRFICIHAATAGEKRIYTAEECMLFDIFENRPVGEKAWFHDFSMNLYETKYFYIKY